MSGTDEGTVHFSNLSLTNTAQPARLNLYLLNQNIITESKAAKGRVGEGQGPQRVRVVGEDGPKTAEDGPGALLANRPVSDCADIFQLHSFSEHRPERQRREMPVTASDCREGRKCRSPQPQRQTAVRRTVN